MAQIKRADLRRFDDVFGMGSGYVLDFSDRTMSEWFEDELGIDIDDDRYKARGTSKANRLRSFIETEPEPVVARTLRRLWDYREATFTPLMICGIIGGFSLGGFMVAYALRRALSERRPS